MTFSNSSKSVVSKHLRKHRKELNRYIKEVKESQKGRLTKKKAQQMAYSYLRANEELSVCDALEEMKRSLAPSTTLKRKVSSKQRL